MPPRGPSASWLTRVGVALLQNGAPASSRTKSRAPSIPVEQSPRTGQSGAGGAMLGVTITIEEQPRRYKQRRPQPVTEVAVEQPADLTDSSTHRSEPSRKTDRSKPHPYVDIYDRITERGGMLEID